MWDASIAVKHLREHALPHSIGYCAQYTREAIESGGVTLARHSYAKDYGPSLTAVGFLALPGSPVGNRSLGGRFFIADVAVIQACTGHPYGHMMMYDGSIWISDFKQNEFWPSSTYEREKPSFKIYRYRRLSGPPVSARPTYSYHLPTSVCRILARLL
jgi:hypothetical protein